VLNPKDEQYDYDRIERGYYDEVMNVGTGAQSKWHELKFKKLYRMIGLENPKKLLDIACGPGTFISRLPNIIDCYGVDIAEKQIDYANQKFGKKNAQFLKCKNATYPFDDGTFDVITSIEFIEHISRDSCRQNMIEMKRCLKKGGKLFLTTPNYRSMWPILEYIVSFLTKENYIEQHITHYNRVSLERMLEECGFVNVKVGTYIFLSPFFSYLSSSLSNRLFDFEEKHIKRWGNLLIATGEVSG
jgi:ubiquinone/menaquinone biosynthesis C-methylase UbiE